MKKHILAFGLCILSINHVLAQKRLPYVAVPFLRVIPDARAAGMADVGGATTPDANSLYHNTSKLAFIKNRRGFSLNYTPWLRAIIPDLSLINLSAYNKLDDKQAFGVSMTYNNLGNIEFTTNTGASAGNFMSREMALMGGYSRKLSPKFSMGIAGKYIYSNLAGNNAPNGIASKPGSAIAGDITFYYANDFKNNDGEVIEWALGGGITNMGTKISYGEPVDTNNPDFQIPNYLPANLKLGSSVGYNLDDHNKITLALDLDKLMTPTPPESQLINGKRQLLGGMIPNRSLFSSLFSSFGDAPDGFGEEIKEMILSVGAEYTYNNLFAVRSGYHYEHQDKGGRKFFTAGLGAKIQERYSLDFSYLMPFTSNNPLANTFRISMTFDLEPKTVQDKITE